MFVEENEQFLVQHTSYLEVLQCCTNSILIWNIILVRY